MPDVPDFDTDEKMSREVDTGSTWFVDVPVSGANCLGAFKGIRTAFIAHCCEAAACGSTNTPVSTISVQFRFI